MHRHILKEHPKYAKASRGKPRTRPIGPKRKMGRPRKPKVEANKENVRTRLRAQSNVFEPEGSTVIKPPACEIEGTPNEALFMVSDPDYY